MKFQCMTCVDLNFPSLEALEEHERAGHPQPIKPDEQFNKTLAEIEEDKKKKAIEQAQLNKLREGFKPAPAAILKKQPLQLKYQFIGQDDEGHEVKTLVMDNEAGYFVSAYCLVCDKQIESIKVAKLPEARVLSTEQATAPTNDTKKTDNKVSPKM